MASESNPITGSRRLGKLVDACTTILVAPGSWNGLLSSERYTPVRRDPHDVRCALGLHQL